MPNDSPGTPSHVWLNQPLESAPIEMKQLRDRANTLRAMTKKKMLKTVAGPIASGLFSVYLLASFASIRDVLEPLLAFALVWSFAGLYFLNRGISTGSVPDDLAFQTGLQFCRTELQRHHDLVRRSLLWSFGPILTTITVFLLALKLVSTPDRALLPNGLPFVGAVMVSILAYFAVRLRELRRLNRDINQLKEDVKQKLG